MLQLAGERVRWNEADKMIPAENFGLRVMSVGLTTPDADTPLGWRSAVATSALVQMLDDVEWGPLDVLAVDLPPGTGDVQLTLAQELRISSAVVVTTPAVVATDDVRRALRMLLEIGVPVAGVVENMSGFVAPDTGIRYHPFGQGGGRMLAHDYGVPFLGEIPLDPRIGAAADAGTPIAAVGDDGQRAIFEGLAARIWELSITRRSEIMKTQLIPAMVAVAALLAAPAVRAGEAPTKTPELVEKGRVSYAKNCVACHGKGGEGDGPAAKASSRPGEPGHPSHEGGRRRGVRRAGDRRQGDRDDRLQAPPRGERWALAYFVEGLAAAKR